VDRLSGAVHFCTPAVCQALPLVTPTVKPASPGGQAPVPMPPAPPQRPPPTGASLGTS